MFIQFKELSVHVKQNGAKTKQIITSESMGMTSGQINTLVHFEV